MATVTPVTSPWPARRRRVQELAERWPFAREMLQFYAILAEAQERAFDAAVSDDPATSELEVYVAERVMPLIIEASAASGPQALVAGVLERFHVADLAEVTRAWLRGDDQTAVDRFLARAAAGPVLEALGDAAGMRCDAPADDRHCPICGGLPQVAYFSASSEELVTGHRFLVCSRCAHAWAYARMTCASCGEDNAQRLRVYSELGTAQAERTREPGGATFIKPGTPQPAVGNEVQFPHLRIDGCTTCRRYILTVDLARDGLAVPLVDELGAVPLSLRAKEFGMTKVVSNVLGL